MDRRAFLRLTGAAAVGGVGALALAEPAWAGTGVAHAGATGYGSLDGRKPDHNGIVLPEGFRSNLVATGGELVGSTGYRWHAFSDGAACIALASGGWYYVANSEVDNAGGVSALRCDATGRVEQAYRLLEGTSTNCSGGATPWGTWLSCEETEHGFVWECDPAAGRAPTRLPALGEFRHEAVAVDAVAKVIYLTEDQPDGLLYRFVPDVWPALDRGRLEALRVRADQTSEWVPIPRPSGSATPTRQQAGRATPFNGGEGLWLTDRALYFTTKGDNMVHVLDLRTSQHRIVYDDLEPLYGVDQLIAEPITGNLFCAEDGGNMEINVITPAGAVAPFLRVVGHDDSEISGLAFAPDASRLYFSSQRAPTRHQLRDLVPAAVDDDRTVGAVYEVLGPFAAGTGAGAARVVARSGTGGEHVGGDSSVPYLLGAGVGAGALLAGGFVAWHQHRRA